MKVGTVFQGCQERHLLRMSNTTAAGLNLERGIFLIQLQSLLTVCPVLLVMLGIKHNSFALMLDTYFLSALLLILDDTHSCFSPFKIH